MRALFFFTLAAGSAAQSTPGSFDPGFLPAAEDVTAEQKQGLLTMLNGYRQDHGACNTLQWDDTITSTIKSTLSIVDTSGAEPMCYDDSKVNPQGSSSFTQVEGYVMTWDPVNPAGSGTTWDGADAVTDLMYDPGTLKTDNMLWRSASRVGCVVCRQGWVNHGFHFFLTCMFEERTGPKADNVLPVGSTCDLCIGKPPCDGAIGCKQAGSCNSTSGLCEYLNAGDGTTCDDSDDTTTADVCTAGVCQGTQKCTGVVCNVVGQCDESSVCEATTGQCGVTLKQDGTACDDGDASTQNDQCTSGTCSGENLCASVTCTAATQCHQVGTCDMATGTCKEVFKIAGEACDDGNAGTTGDVCDGAGQCAGQDLCASVACPTSECTTSSTCDPATGSCVPVMAADGTTCDDNNPVTVGDICTNGVCFGKNGCTLIDCTPTDPCQAVGICVNDNNASAYCSYEYKPEGTACDDGLDNTARDQCKPSIRASEMKCQGVDLCASVQCPLSECKASALCNKQNGTCSYSDMPDGVACDDADAATTNDVCMQGECRGESLCATKDCSGSATMCASAKCNDATGQCDLVPKPQGTACDDGNNATLNDQCTAAGECAGTDKCAGKTCNAGTGTCVKAAGRCDMFTGNCIYDKEADGTPCDDQNPNTNGDSCFAGTCAPGADCTVILRKQHSNAPCTAGKTYGFAPDGKFFVDAGCRGDFTIVANNHDLECSSWGWKYTECMTSPFLPACSQQVAQPCPTTGPCLGFALTGNGNCVDAAGNPFNYVAVKVPTSRDCIEAARAAQPIAGAEFIQADGTCRLLLPAGVALPPIPGSVGQVTNSVAVAPVVSANGQAGVLCYVPGDRCLGVVCQPFNDCHIAGVCQPATGMCTNPWKADNSFCDDGDATTHTDSNPSPTAECWVADSYFPGTSCKKATGDTCLLPIGAWATKDQCCTPGAAHQAGCTGTVVPDGDDQVADRPEQCVCDTSLVISPLTTSDTEYCASKDSPNGNGHTCSVIPTSGVCGSSAFKCRTPKSVPPTIGVACACGAFKQGCGNTHHRVCVDFSVQNNACYPSNTNGACSNNQWFVCFTKVGYTVPVVTGSVSSNNFQAMIAIMAGVLMNNVRAVSSCRGGSRRHGHSSHSMRKAGCQTGSWGTGWTHNRVAAWLGLEEEDADAVDEITFEFTGLSTDEEILANQKLMTNMDMATKGKPYELEKLIQDPNLRATVQDASTWVKGSVLPMSAPVGDGETAEEINEAMGGNDAEDEEGSSALTGVLVALGTAGCLAVIAAAIFINRRSPHGITVEEMSHGRGDLSNSDTPYTPVGKEMELADESGKSAAGGANERRMSAWSDTASGPRSPSVRI
ncbi:Extracellular matrix protein A [Diplonema papillatum]|nr:Extracellular matrix protein A [Diplonema papillatum]